MTSVKARAEIDADGMLRLTVPAGLPAGGAEVLVVVRPDAVEAPAPAPRAARIGLFIGRPEHAALDVDASLREMNEGWKAKLADLP